jgi:16S rRNA (cytosine967-C5)-methyltransferase
VGGVRRNGVSSTAPPGLAARQLAADLITAVLSWGHSLGDALEGALGRESHRGLAAPDRAFARLIAATVLRRLGQLEAILATFIARPLPRDQVSLKAILLAAAAQLVFLSTPPHAAINLAVEQCRRDPRARRFDRLANAVLRKVAVQGSAIEAGQDAVRLNIPEWLFARWTRSYGEDLARRIGAATLREAARDLTARAEPEKWAERLGGVLLPTGTIRLLPDARVEDLPGYREGAWWVQDAAAALPPRLFGDVAGCEAADLCAAPGGKTALLASLGANVTAVDISAERLRRLEANLARLRLTAALVQADAATWNPGRTFDAVLLDAPCTATGTIRRHPDILRLRRPSDVARLAVVQAALLKNAMSLVRPGGTLVYCTCSLEPEEGPLQIERVLAADDFRFLPIRAEEIGADPSWITARGELRTFPCHLPLEPDALSGLDGFYAARLLRSR